jgi:hypothetical protein
MDEFLRLLFQGGLSRHVPTVVDVLGGREIEEGLRRVGQGDAMGIPLAMLGASGFIPGNRAPNMLRAADKGLDVLHVTKAQSAERARRRTMDAIRQADADLMSRVVPPAPSVPPVPLERKDLIFGEPDFLLNTLFNFPAGFGVHIKNEFFGDER